MSKPKLTAAEKDRAAMYASYPAAIEKNRKEASQCEERCEFVRALHLYVVNLGLAVAYVGEVDGGRRVGLREQIIQGRTDIATAIMRWEVFEQTGAAVSLEVR